MFLSSTLNFTVVNEILQIDLQYIDIHCGLH